MKDIPTDKTSVAGENRTINKMMGAVLMNPSEMSAYDAFLHSGKIEDYLKYVGVRQQSATEAVTGAAVTGDTGAYHDRRDRAAGARD